MKLGNGFGNLEVVRWGLRVFGTSRFGCLVVIDVEAQNVEDIGRDDLVEKTGELGIGEVDLVASNFWRKFCSKAARSRMSGRSVYLRLSSFFGTLSQYPAP